MVMEDSDSKQICARGTAKSTHSMRVYKISQRIGVWDYLLMSTEKEETMRLQWGVQLLDLDKYMPSDKLRMEGCLFTKISDTEGRLHAVILRALRNCFL